MNSASLMRGVVRLPPDSMRMTDADEEIFLLYTSLAARKAADESTTRFRGLGHIDSREDTLTISLNIGTSGAEEQVVSSVGGPKHKAKRGSAKGKSRKTADDFETLDVEIVQDKTALRTRRGDTGSILWHASVDFAETLLQQLHRKDPVGFLDPAVLSTGNVLELGAGTGLLSVVLSPFVRHYTVTDIEELVPLIRKNISRNLQISHTALSTSPSKAKHPLPQSNTNVTATALDWVDLHNAPPLLQARMVPTDPTDLLLVVDCIYHPSLLPALLTTIDLLTIPGRTAVVVVVELRAEDVVRDFLQGWLDKSTDWEIWSVSRLLDGPYAVWVGWKNNVAHQHVIARSLAQ